MEIDRIEEDERDLVTEQAIEALLKEKQTGFIQGYPHAKDATIQGVVSGAFEAQKKIAEIDKHQRTHTPLNKDVTPFDPPLDPSMPSKKELQEDFLLAAKEHEEETGYQFSIDELELLFAEYVKYLSECKLSITQYKNKVKEIFNQTIKNYSASYRKPWELVASIAVASLHVTAAVGGFVAGQNEAVQKKFIAPVSGLAQGGGVAAQWLTTKFTGERTKYQVLSEAQRSNQEDVNQGSQQPGRKQEEIQQKYSQMIQSKSDAARSINAG